MIAFETELEKLANDFSYDFTDAEVDKMVSKVAESSGLSIDQARFYYTSEGINGLLVDLYLKRVCKDEGVDLNDLRTIGCDTCKHSTRKDHLECNHPAHFSHVWEKATPIACIDMRTRQCSGGKLYDAAS